MVLEVSSAERHMRKEREQLVNQYEREEEFLTNTLSKKLSKLHEEKDKMEKTVEQRQEGLVNQLLNKIENLKNQVRAKQHELDNMQAQRIELENVLEREQESVVLRLSRKIRHLENEKNNLEQRLQQQFTDRHSTGDEADDRERRRGLLQQAVLAPFRLTEASTQTSEEQDTVGVLREQVMQLTTELHDMQFKWKHKEKCYVEELVKLRLKTPLADTSAVNDDGEDCTQSDTKESKRNVNKAIIESPNSSKRRLDESAEREQASHVTVKRVWNKTSQITSEDTEPSTQASHEDEHGGKENENKEDSDQ